MMCINERELLIEKYISPTNITKDGIEYYTNKRGELHNFNDQPSYVSYYEKKHPKFKFWFKNGLEHRGKNKPSSIMFNEKGNIIHKWWYKNGKFIKEMCFKNKIEY